MRTLVTRYLPILLLACGASSSWAANHAVTVGGGNDLTFSPASLTISVGDTVTFTNAGGFHNVAADDNSFRCAGGCANDGQGGTGSPSDSAWSSTITFNQAGTVNYHCDVHVSMGMRGSIVVQAATTPPPPPTNVPITSAFSGAWYGPGQSGHGLLLEVVAGATPTTNNLLAYWFTFNPDGTQQAWFGGVGPINGDTAVVSAIQTTGGRWIPNFDPNSVVNTPWGSLTFTFSDCNHGHVDFTSTVPGYGTNSMDLLRLTQPVGVTCDPTTPTTPDPDPGSTPPPY